MDHRRWFNRARTAARRGVIQAGGASSLIVVAILMLSLALGQGRGYLTPFSIVCSLLSGVLLVAAMVRHGQSLSPPFAATLIVAMVSLISSYWLLGAAFVVPAGAVAAAMVAMCCVTLPVMRVGFGAAIVGIWAVVTTRGWSWGRAAIDTFGMLKGGGDDLLHGGNPYLASFPSTTAGVSHFSFPYGPAALVISAVGDALGDPRVANALMLLAAAGLLILMAHRLGSPAWKSRTELAAAVMAGLLPVDTFMLLRSWIEVDALAAFLLWLLLSRRHPRWATVAVAVAIGVHYSILVFLLPLWLWSPRLRRQITMGGIVSAGVIYLPFVLWTGPARFYSDLIGVQTHVALNTSSLSLNGFLIDLGGHALPVAVVVVVLVAAVVAMLFWRPRTLADMLLLSGALGYLTFFFAPWAYFNQWYMVLYVLAAALFTVGVVEETALPSPLARLIPALRVVPASGPASAGMSDLADQTRGAEGADRVA